MHAALFLDIDGTILEFADRPDDVVVPSGLIELLVAIEEKLGGALALISGRPAASIDQLFAPRRFALAGSHGAELRFTPSAEIDSCSPATLPAEVLHAVDAIRAGLPTLFIETKPCGIALHHPDSSALRAQMLSALGRVIRSAAPAWTLLCGRRVVEVKLDGVTKGTGIAQLRERSPFRDRIPIFIGDDITDIDAFDYVRDAGGVTIAVGERITEHAQFALDGPGDTHAWLAALATALDSGYEAVRVHVLGTQRALR